MYGMQSSTEEKDRSETSQRDPPCGEYRETITLGSEASRPVGRAAGPQRKESLWSNLGNSRLNQRHALQCPCCHGRKSIARVPMWRRAPAISTVSPKKPWGLPAPSLPRKVTGRPAL